MGRQRWWRKSLSYPCLPCVHLSCHRYQHRSDRNGEPRKRPLEDDEDGNDGAPYQRHGDEDDVDLDVNTSDGENPLNAVLLAREREQTKDTASKK